MSSTIDTTTPSAPTAPLRRHRRIPPVTYGILVVATFFGIIGLAYAGGAWQTTGRTTGEGRPTLQGVSAMEVKGWMAIGDVADTFGVPLEDVVAAFDLPPATAPQTPLKELESDQFSVPALREWLASEGYATP
jgi:hypothetical protein